MAVAFVSAGTGVGSAGSTTLNPGLPASRVNGNILLCAVLVYGSADVSNISAGWTQVSAKSGPTSGMLRVYARAVDGSEAAPTVTLTAAVNARSQIVQYSGVNNKSWLVGSNNTAGAGTTHTAAANTGTPYVGAWLYIHAQGGSSPAGTPAGWTEDFEDGDASSTVYISFGSQPASAGVSSSAVSLTGSNVTWWVQTIYLYDSSYVAPIPISGLSTSVTPIGPFKSSTSSGIRTCPTTTGNFGVGTAANNERLGQTFTALANHILTTVLLRVTKSGTPSDNLIVELYATSGGLPTTLIAASTTAVSSSNFDSSVQNYQAYEFSNIALTEGTVYAITVRRGGALSASNYVNCRNNATSQYAGGTALNYVSGAWQAIAGDVDMVINGITEAWYIIGVPTADASRIQIWKATDPSSSWSTVLPANGTQVTGTVAFLAADYYRDIIHFGAATSSTAISAYVYYLAFSPLNDAFSTSQEIVLNNVDTSQSTGAATNFCAVVYRPNENAPAMLFNGLRVANMGSSYSQVYWSRRTGSQAWSAPAQASSGGQVNWYQTEAVIGGDGSRCHFFWDSISGSAAKTRSLNSSQALQTEVAINHDFRAQAVSYDFSGTRKIVAVGQQGGAVTASRFDSADVPTVSNATIETVAARPTRLFFDTDGTLYAVYSDNSLFDLYVEQSTDNGATWGSKATMLAGTITTSDLGLARDGHFVYQRGNNLVIGYVYLESGAYWYNEYVLRTKISDAWSAIDKTSGVSLSNADKTATAAVTATHGVRSTTGISTSSTNKYYAELKLDNFVSGTRPVIGITKSDNSLVSLTQDYAAVNAGDGGVYIETLNYTGATFDDGDILSIAWDPVAKKLWFRKTALSWLGAGGAVGDPAAGTNGHSLSGLADGTYHLHVQFATAAESVTLRTEAAELTQTAPAGYLSWMGESLVQPNIGTLASGPAALVGTATAISTGTGALTAAGATLVSNFALSSSTGTGALVAQPGGPISGAGTVSWNALATTLTPAVATLAATGDVTTPPAIGTGTLATGAAAISSTGVVQWVVTSAALAPAASTVASAGVASSSASGALASSTAAVVGAGLYETPPRTGTGALAPASGALAASGSAQVVVVSAVLGAGTSTLVSAGNTSSNATGVLSAAVAAVVGTGTYSTPPRTGTGTLSPAVSAIAASGSAQVVVVSAILGAAASTVASAGIASSNATGALTVSSAATLSGTGSVVSAPATGTGALAPAAATLLSNGSSASVGTSVLAPGASAVAGAGSSQASATGAMAASASVVGGNGVSSSRSTSAALSAQSNFLQLGNGVSLSSGTAALTPAASTVVSVGVGSSRSTSAVLASSDAALSGTGFMAESGAAYGDLRPSASVLSSSGVSRSASTSAALSDSQATLSSSGVGSSAGAGAVSSASASLTGVILATSLGTASLSTQAASLAGSAIIASVGSGALTSTAAALTASGVARWSAAGVLTAGTASTTAVGLSVSRGTAVLSSTAATLFGSGTFTATGTGALPADVATLSGVGQIAAANVGTLAAGTAAMVGAGARSWAATGNLLAQDARLLSSTGVVRWVATGALTADAPNVSGAGTVAWRATGALPSAAATLSGTGVRQSVLSGALLAQVATITSTGRSGYAATGVLAAQAPALTATGAATWRATGALPAGQATANGVGVSKVAGTGALAAQKAVVLGSEGQSINQGTGNLQAAARVMTGSGLSRSVGTGALIEPPHEVAGQAVSRSVGTGSLSGARFTLQGVAASGALGVAALAANSATFSAGKGLAQWVASGTLAAISSALTGTGLSRAVGTSTLTPSRAMLQGQGLVAARGDASLVSKPASLTGQGRSSSVGIGSLIEASRVIAGTGGLFAKGTGALHATTSALDVVGVSGSKGSGAISAKPSKLAGFARLTAYGPGVLETGSAKVSGDDLVVGIGAIAAVEAMLAGVGEVGVPVFPPPKPIPGSYPGTAMWSGGALTKTWDGQTALPSTPPPPWWLGKAA